MDEKKLAPEAGASDAPKVDNPPAAPAEQKEAKVEGEKIDPRIVEIVGKEKIQSAFGDKPEEDGKPTEEKPEEKKEEEAPKEEPKKPDQEKPEEEKAPELPKVPPLEPKPTRLDRRLASRFIRNLHLAGEEKIPTEEEVLADLKKYSKEEKIQALHFHLRKEKELRGEKPTDELEEDDKAAIQEADREAIRQEVLQEEHVKGVVKDFVEFVNGHPELDETKKEFNPLLAQAVEKLTFPFGPDGPMAMPISEAFETVTAQIAAVKEEQAKEEKKAKDKSLSGVLSGTGESPAQEKVLDWPEVERIQNEDPELYRKMLAEGKFKHLM